MIDVFLILLPLALSFLTLSALLYFSLRREQTDLHDIQIFLISFVLIMVISFILELMYGAKNAMIVWNVPYYIGLAGSFFCVLFYCLKFLDIKKWLTPFRLGLWGLIPVMGIVLVITDPFLGLYYDSVSVSNFGPLTYLSNVPGVGFYIYVVYCLLLILFLSYLLIREYFSAVQSNHDVAVVMVLMLGVLFGNFLVIEFFNIDIPSTYSFLILITILMVISFILTSRIENRISSPTYKNVLQELEAGIVVLDLNDRIMFSNKMAQSCLQVKRGDTVPEDLQKVLFSHMDDMGAIEMPILCGDQIRYFDIKTESLCDEEGQQKARLIILNDINDLVYFRNDLLKMQEKMNILSSITKHDILNQLTVIMGYGELMMDNAEMHETHRKQISTILKASHSISLQLEFLRDYQEVGINRPTWFPLSELMGKAREQTDIAGITLEYQAEGREIYADPMIEKVFLNLIGNTLQHGGSAHKICLKSNIVNGDLIITFEDDGIGIKASDKEKIFNRDFGKGSGLGLFLSRSILAITGIEISENGTEGQGACFVIRVPKDMHRASP